MPEERYIALVGLWFYNGRLHFLTLSICKRIISFLYTSENSKGREIDSTSKCTCRFIFTNDLVSQNMKETISCLTDDMLKCWCGIYSSQGYKFMPW